MLYDHVYSDKGQKELFRHHVIRTSILVKGIEGPHVPRRGPKLKKTPIFFVDAKRSEIAQEFQKHKS